MDGIHDLGGMQGFGSLRPPSSGEPTFALAWEKRAFAMGLLAARISGTNVDAFRHAINRVTPLEYLADGYFGRWLRGAENLLTDSAIIAAGAVDARARKALGQDVGEPPAPAPRRPDYRAGGPGSLRPMELPPRFSPGDPVRARDLHPCGHTRLPRYVRGRVGAIRRVQPAQVFPDTNAHFAGEHPQHVYSVRFNSQVLWGPEAESFVVDIDLYDDYLEPA